jgi:hypothetical protein
MDMSSRQFAKFAMAILCCAPMAPCFPDVLARSGLVLPVAGAAEVRSPEMQESDYLRMHREIMAPIPFRYFEQTGGERLEPIERRIERDPTWDQLDPRLRDRVDSVWLTLSPSAPALQYRRP